MVFSARFLMKVCFEHIKKEVRPNFPLCRAKKQQIWLRLRLVLHRPLAQRGKSARSIAGFAPKRAFWGLKMGPPPPPSKSAVLGHFSVLDVPRSYLIDQHWTGLGSTMTHSPLGPQLEPSPTGDQ